MNKTTRTVLILLSACRDLLNLDDTIKNTHNSLYYALKDPIVKAINDAERIILTKP